MKKLILMLGMGALLLSGPIGCTTDAYTGESKVANTTWGTVGGAAVGAGVGALVSKNSAKGALIGGLAGGAVGAGIGYYLDDQEAELRKELQATGVSVVRQQDSILLVMPGNITFLTNSSDINSGFYPTLNSVAKVLKKYDNSTVMVTGHTDSTGNASQNLDLSRARAQSVASYLTGQGIKAKRFEVMGFGSSNPIASNSTESGRQQNRRVEIKIIPNK